MRPIERRGRVTAIDVIRGIALLGIVIENVRFFAMPVARAIQGPWSADGSRHDAIASFLGLVLGHYKFLGLFTMLFGFGLAAQRARLVASGVRSLPFELRRIGWLAVVGLFHGLGLFFGDILFVFAGVALLALPFLGRSTGVRLGLGICLVVLSGVLAARGPLQTWLDRPADDASLVVDRPVPDSSEASTGGETRMTDPASSPAGREFETRFRNWRSSIGYGVRFYGWYLLGLVLVGTTLRDVGFFESRHADRRTRTALACLAVGLPLEFVHFLPASLRGGDGFAAVAWAFLHPATAAAVVIGYAGLATTLVERRRFPLARPLAALGRMSLSCYLLESMLLAAIFRPWGLDWFGGVGDATATLIGTGVFVLVLLAGTIWSHWFLLGPFEWCWRWFTYLQRPPIRRIASPAGDGSVDLASRRSADD